MIQNNYTEAHEFLVAVLGAVPYGIVSIDLEGNITMCNEKALNHLGLDKKPDVVIETHFPDHLEHLPDLKSAIENRLDKGRKPIDLTAIFFNDKYLTIHGRRILNGMIITIEDVTAAKAQERLNLNAMLQGQEAERKRLAAEIHDGIGPVMSTIKLHLDAVKSDLNEASEKTFRKIGVMSEMIYEVSNELRSISHALMPSALEDFGLVAALDNLSRKANESEKIKVVFLHSGMKERLNKKVELGLFRITQELLNNAFKYANAKTITVQLIKYSDSIMLTVEDDGSGFEKKDSIGKGIGLRNIQTRVKSLQGHFSIDTQKGQGVHATIEIPAK